jgi:hypothetical protein
VCQLCSQRLLDASSSTRWQGDEAESASVAGVATVATGGAGGAGAEMRRRRRRPGAQVAAKGAHATRRVSSREGRVWPGLALALGEGVRARRASVPLAVGAGWQPGARAETAMGAEGRVSGASWAAMHSQSGEVEGRSSHWGRGRRRWWSTWDGVRDGRMSWSRDETADRRARGYSTARPKSRGWARNLSRPQCAVQHSRTLNISIQCCFRAPDTPDDTGSLCLSIHITSVLRSGTSWSSAGGRRATGAVVAARPDLGGRYLDKLFRLLVLLRALHLQCSHAPPPQPCRRAWHSAHGKLIPTSCYTRSDDTPIFFFSQPIRP